MREVANKVTTNIEINVYIHKHNVVMFVITGMYIGCIQIQRQNRILPEEKDFRDMIQRKKTQLSPVFFLIIKRGRGQKFPKSACIYENSNGS